MPAAREILEYTHLQVISLLTRKQQLRSVTPELKNFLNSDVRYIAIFICVHILKLEHVMQVCPFNGVDYQI